MDQYLSWDRLTSHHPNLQVFLPVWVPQAILFNSIATSVVAADKQPVEQVLPNLPPDLRSSRGQMGALSCRMSSWCCLSFEGAMWQSAFRRHGKLHWLLCWLPFKSSQINCKVKLSREVTSKTVVQRKRITLGYISVTSSMPENQEFHMAHSVTLLCLFTKWQ